MTVTKNLTLRHMRGDNYYLRFRKQDESANHATFSVPQHYRHGPYQLLFLAHKFS